MRVLIVNPILYTSEVDKIAKVFSIKDTMIYTLSLAFLKSGHQPVLAAAAEYRPVSGESYPFEIQWFPCVWKGICKPRCLPMLQGFRKYLKKNKDSFDYIISSEVFSLLSLIGVMEARKKIIIWHELGAHNKMMKQIPSKIWYHCIASVFMKYTERRTGKEC